MSDELIAKVAANLFADPASFSSEYESYISESVYRIWTFERLFQALGKVQTKHLRLVISDDIYPSLNLVRLFNKQGQLSQILVDYRGGRFSYDWVADRYDSETNKVPRNRHPLFPPDRPYVIDGTDCFLVDNGLRRKFAERPLPRLRLEIQETGTIFEGNKGELIVRPDDMCQERFEGWIHPSFFA